MAQFRGLVNCQMRKRKRLDSDSEAMRNSPHWSAEVSLYISSPLLWSRGWGLMVGRSSIILLALDPEIRVYRSFCGKDSRVYTLGIILKRNEAITAIAMADTDYHAGAPFMLERD